MKRTFKIFGFSVSVMFLGLLINSCSSQKSELELVFPLGISYDEVMKDEQITSRKARVEHTSTEDMIRELATIYALNDVEFYNTYEEDNFSIDPNNMKDIEELEIRDYVYGGVQYYSLTLIFKKGKLVQIAGEAEDELDANLLNSVITKLKNPARKAYITTLHNSTAQATRTHDTPVTIYNSGKIYLETQNEEQDEAFFNYYTEKIIPFQELW